MDIVGLISNILEFGSSVTEAVNDDLNRKFKLTYQENELANERLTAKEKLNLIIRGSAEKIRYETTISNLLAKNLKAQDESRLNNWINDPATGLVCSDVYDKTGSVPPTCERANFSAKDIEFKREADRQRNYKIVAFSIIILIIGVYFFAKKNKK